MLFTNHFCREHLQGYRPYTLLRCPVPCPTLGRHTARVLRRSYRWTGVSGTSDGMKGGHIHCCVLSAKPWPHVHGLGASWRSYSSCSWCPSSYLPGPISQPEQHLKVYEHDLIQPSGCSIFFSRLSDFFFFIPLKVNYNHIYSIICTSFRPEHSTAWFLIP